MTSILDRIANYKQEEVRKSKEQCPLSTLRGSNPSPVRNFVKALKTKPAIIAEIKRASPSQGIIRENFDVVDIATAYDKHGANCLSVLTDKAFFQGDPSYLELAKQHTNLPVLRKDFIVDEYQVFESRALGADCILLIVALLDDQQLHDYCQLAQDLGMSVLIESHTSDELERAIRLPTPLMGINNRDLHSFKIDLNQSIKLAHQVPSEKLVVAESGIRSHQDIDMMEQHGIHVFLIGEAFMRSDNFGSLFDKLSRRNI